MVSKLFTIIIFFSLALFPAAESHAKKGFSKPKKSSSFKEKPKRIYGPCDRLENGAYTKEDYQRCKAHKERKPSDFSSQRKNKRSKH